MLNSRFGLPDDLRRIAVLAAFIGLGNRRLDCGNAISVKAPDSVRLI
jgi:hypothetical protein